MFVFCYTETYITDVNPSVLPLYLFPKWILPLSQSGHNNFVNLTL